MREKIPGRRTAPVRREAVRTILTNLGRALKMVWAATPGWTTAWGGLLLVQGLLPAASVYLTKVLIDALTVAVGGGLAWEAVRPVLLPAGLMVAVLLLTQVIKELTAWVRAGQAEYMQDHIKERIHAQAAVVDLEFFETPEYFDQMERANREANPRIRSLLENIGGLFRNATTLVAIAALLVPYGVWVPLALLLSTLPAFWVVIWYNRHHHAWWKDTTEKRRWVEYFNAVLTLPYYAAEVRIFALNDFFQAAYRNLRTELRAGRLALLRRRGLAGFAAGLLALLVSGGALAWMLVGAFQGRATLGDLALFYQAFNQGQGLLRTLLGNLGQLYGDLLFLEHLFFFLDLQPKVEQAVHPAPVPERLHTGIVIEHVDFRYPGSDRLALEDFSLTIPAGKTVAIVGPNGAGKSTLIKLLCRFYDPVAGRVLLDGVDYRDLSREDLWRRLTILFQIHVNYAGPVRGSIEIGDVDAEHTPERLAEAARLGMADELIEKMPHGFETILHKQFSGGIDLSGGEWQRLALARAFYRNAPVVLLDEPTSYMDSWTETRWIERFLDFARDRTALIVTHRFSTAIRADLIYVMNEGKVIETGSHEELLALNGFYASSWRAQVQAGDDALY